MGNFRRRYKKTRGARKKVVYNKRLPLGLVFPDVYMCKLIYRAQGSLSASGLTGYVWRGNSIHDPDFTGGGHQPLYADQLALLYSAYRVMGCKCTVTYYSGSDSLANVGLYPTTTGTALPATLTFASEVPYGKWRVNTGYQAQGKTTLSTYMSSKKLFGKSIIMDDNYASFFGNNPVNQWYWIMWAYDSLGGTVAQTFTVRLTYYVRCEQRINVGTSTIE